MKRQNSKWMLQVAALSATTAFLVQPLRAEVLEKSKRVHDTIVHYKVVLPNDYDPTKTYPAILAFGGGPQTMNTVDSILSRNFRAEAEKRGYIVVAPAAPDGDLFFEDGDTKLRTTSFTSRGCRTGASRRFMLRQRIRNTSCP